MPAHSPPSPQMHPAKRLRQSSPDRDSPSSINSATNGPSPATSDQLLPDGPPGAGAAGANKQDGAGAGGGAGGGGGGSARVGQSSNFRNVSACNRCRLRKNRCDQKLPSCASCEKANVACVGYDPITKKEIPRRSVAPLPGARYNARRPALTHAPAMSIISKPGSNSSRRSCARTMSPSPTPIVWSTARGWASTRRR